jgi:hypothetical protein
LNKLSMLVSPGAANRSETLSSPKTTGLRLELWPSAGRPVRAGRYRSNRILR